MDLGPFRAKETILQGRDGTVYHSRQLRTLTPYRATFGYDVLVYVGRALFMHCHSEQEIIEDLARNNVVISQREIGFLGRKFIAYLAIAHQRSAHRLKAHMALQGGYILHIDGTCERNSPHLFTGIDGIANIVLDNIKLASEKAEFIVPFLKQIQMQYGDPIALVHDMGQGILSAVKSVFKDTPDFICHFHFLRDIGKDLLETDYSKIRTRLTKHKIRGLLRRRAKVLEEIINDDPKAAHQLHRSLDNGKMDPLFLESMPTIMAYTMIHWAFDASDQLDGYGFPFDCPHLVFYQRLKAVYGFINEYSASGNRKAINNRALLSLWRPLTKIVEDQQLTRAASHMQEKMNCFKKLRKALEIAVPGGKKALNDDGLDADIKSIEEKIIEFREEIMTDEKLCQKDEYTKMIEQIDKYWEKLFADPITVNTKNGQIIIQPQRTNNILERFFRDFKRGNRKKSGTISLNRTLRTILADTPLVKNLDNPEYMTILLDGRSTLEECFAKIDSGMVVEKLKAEQRKNEGLNPEIKKIVRLPNLPERMIALVAR